MRTPAHQLVPVPGFSQAIDRENHLIQLIPVLIVAPLFIRQKIEFWLTNQATMAFATLLGVFSLVITQFQEISAYASVLLHLGEVIDAAEESRANSLVDEP